MINRFTLSVLITLFSLGIFAAPESNEKIVFPKMTEALLAQFLNQQMEECKDHFDLRPFLKLAVDDLSSITASEKSFATEAMQGLFAKGRLAIPESSVDPVKTRQCADKALGILLGHPSFAEPANVLGKRM